MRKRIKPYLIIFITAFVLLSIFAGCASTSTTDERIYAPRGKSIFITDENNLIGDNIERELNEIMIELERQTQIEFDIIATESLVDKTIEEYSNIIFSSLEINKQNNAILLVFSKEEGKARIEVGRGLEGRLKELKCNEILEDYFLPYSQINDYSKATVNTAKAIINIVAEDYVVIIDEANNIGIEEDKDKAKEETGFSFPSFIVIAIIFIVILTIFPKIK